METRAGYVIVGAFVLLLFVAGMVGAIWFGDVRLDQQVKRYATHFEGSVTGLNVGSQVRYRGVPVGTVSDIRIDSGNVERIVVMLEIDAEVPIKTDMHATLEAQGLTGIGYIQIGGGTMAADDLLPAQMGGAVPEIPVRQSAIAKVFETAPEIAEQAALIMGRLQAFLSEENEQAFNQIIVNLGKLSDTLGDRAPEIDRMIVSSANTLENVEAVSEDLVPLIEDLRDQTATISDELQTTLATFRGTASGVDGELASLAESLKVTSAQINNTAARLEEITVAAKPGVADFSNAGLYELTQFLVEARSVIERVDSLLRQIDRDPTQLLFGNKGGQVQAQ